MSSHTPAVKPSSRPAWLVLQDGSIFKGQSIGFSGTCFGELVFNTTLTGYQEVLTDPSYRGQIVMMTYPEIGNTGISQHDYESEMAHVSGFIVKRLSPISSSWRSQVSLEDYLQRNRVVGIQGIDTRAVTRKIRDNGSMKSGITTDYRDAEAFLKLVQTQPDFSEQDFIGQVTISQPEIRKRTRELTSKALLHRLVVIDYGVKTSILDYFHDLVEELVILPAQSNFSDVLQYAPDAVVLSNGPGDPNVLTHAVETARSLIASGIPTFGICLGHQILALASGARVSKMPFGHHGGNHPVKDLETGRVTITSQNHGYAVDDASIPKDTMRITHINLNDGSIEGFRHQLGPVSSVQFHPEASPGPHDSQYLFERFIREALRSKQAMEV